MFWFINCSFLGILNVVMQITVKKNNEVIAIIGNAGEKIKDLSLQIQKQLQNSFRCDVRIKLGVEKAASPHSTEKTIQMGNWRKKK